ncbi:MAG: DUF6152 family protein [Gammaproteobacteria bacterium]|nr:DUF6152 family protein [Gammaproteobacteria bacterium]
MARRFQFATASLQPLALLSLVLLVPAVGGAHHSWARYDGDNIFVISGTVTKIEWASPHVFMYFDAVDDAGNVTAWTMELDPPTLLRRYGLRHDSVQVGMEITITGVRAVSGAPMMRGVTIELPDGTLHRVSSRV